jgi:hypothetical protein
MGEAGRAMVRARCSTQIISERIAECFDRVLTDATSAK